MKLTIDQEIERTRRDYEYMRGNEPHYKIVTLLFQIIDDLRAENEALKVRNNGLCGDCGTALYIECPKCMTACCKITFRGTNQREDGKE